MSENRHAQVKQLLIEIEAELRSLELWGEQQPSEAALSSPEPFCVDRLCLADWLQWILIPRMRELLLRDLPLPGQCNIFAYAEESFKALEQDCSQLLSLIEKFDQTLSRTH